MNVPGLQSVCHAMLQVVLQDHLAGVVDGAADRRQLDQDLASGHGENFSGKRKSPAGGCVYRISLLNY